MISNCPKCNAQTKGLEYCLECGFKLEAKTGINKFSREETLVCNTCSYPLSDKHVSCPNCGLDQSGHNDESHETKTLSIRSITNYNNKAILKAVSLGQSIAKDIEIPNSMFNINREVVGEDDNSISSKSHAIVTQNNGKWFIENKSSNKALFIEVNKKTELKDGMIILLGNSKFYMFQTE